MQMMDRKNETTNFGKEKTHPRTIEESEFHRICNLFSEHVKLLRDNNQFFTPHQRTFLLFRLKDMISALETNPSEEDFITDEEEEDIFELSD
jgi:hypothetical protein